MLRQTLATVSLSCGLLIAAPEFAEAAEAPQAQPETAQPSRTSVTHAPYSADESYPLYGYDYIAVCDFIKTYSDKANEIINNKSYTDKIFIFDEFIHDDISINISLISINSYYIKFFESEFGKSVYEITIRNNAITEDDKNVTLLINKLNIKSKNKLYNIYCDYDAVKFKTIGNTIKEIVISNSYRG